MNLVNVFVRVVGAATAVVLAGACSGSKPANAHAAATHRPTPTTSAEIDPTPPPGWRQVTLQAGIHSDYLDDLRFSRTGQVQLILSVSGPSVQGARVCLLGKFVHSPHSPCDGFVGENGPGTASAVANLPVKRARDYLGTVEVKGVGEWKLWVFEKV